MMLHLADQDNVLLWGVGETTGKFVNCLGCVFPKNANMLTRMCANEVEHLFAGGCIGMRRNLALETSSAMDAGIDFEKSIDSILNMLECRGGRRVIQVQVRQPLAA